MANRIHSKGDARREEFNAATGTIYPGMERPVNYFYCFAGLQGFRTFDVIDFHKNPVRYLVLIAYTSKLVAALDPVTAAESVTGENTSAKQPFFSKR